MSLEHTVKTQHHLCCLRLGLPVCAGYAAHGWLTIEFNVPDRKVIEVDGADGKEKPAQDDSTLGMPGLQILLDSGEGRLFLLPGL